jgi:hypothetical protein
MATNIGKSEGFGPEDELVEHRKRRWLGKPLKDISIHCNPRKISLKEFTKDVIDGIMGFKVNMDDLNHLQGEEYKV